MVVYFAIFIWGVVMGMSLLILLNKISLHLQTKKVTEEYNTFFTEIKDLIDNNSVDFLVVIIIMLILELQLKLKEKCI